MRPGVLLRLLALAIGYLMTSPDLPVAQDVDAFRARREAYIDEFRRTGELPSGLMSALAAELETTSASLPAGNRGALLFELATLQRIQGGFAEAIATYRQAIEDAGGIGDVAFDAWIGIARAHAYGTKDHGVAAEAFQSAVDVAGPDPSRQHRYTMADYLSQLQSGRGELEAALVNALQADRLADSDLERFYAELDTGDVLQQFAQSCDYRQLVDAKTFSGEADDGWGACRRAVAAAAGLRAGERNRSAAGLEFHAGPVRWFQGSPRRPAFPDRAAGLHGQAGSGQRVRRRGCRRRAGDRAVRFRRIPRFPTFRCWRS